MRELTAKIRFLKHCLGNIKDETCSVGRLKLLRSKGKVMFLATWHLQNMQFASQLLGRHQDEVGKICWDIFIPGIRRRWFRRYYPLANGKERYCLHEALYPGQEIEINCVVPATISNADFRELMVLAGRYRGLSPFKPGEYGLYEVVSISARRGPVDPRLNEIAELDTERAS